MTSGIYTQYLLRLVGISVLIPHYMILLRKSSQHLGPAICIDAYVCYNSRHGDGFVNLHKDPNLIARTGLLCLTIFLFSFSVLQVSVPSCPDVIKFVSENFSCRLYWGQCSFSSLRASRTRPVWDYSSRSFSREGWKTQVVRCQCRRRFNWRVGEAWGARLTSSHRLVHSEYRRKVMHELSE